jgi:hypothetical protein
MAALGHVDPILLAVLASQPSTAPGAAPNTYDLNLPLDLDRDGTNESTLTGTVIFDHAVNGGVPPGTEAALDVALVIDGDLSVDVDMSLEFGATSVEAWGMATVMDSVSGCTLVADIDASTPLMIELPLAPTRSLQTLVAGVRIGAVPVIKLELGGATLTARVEIDQNTNTATVTDARVNGQSVGGFNLLLPPVFVPGISAMMECVVDYTVILVEFFDAIPALIDALTKPQDHPDITIAQKPGSFEIWEFSFQDAGGIFTGEWDSLNQAFSWDFERRDPQGNLVEGSASSSLPFLVQILPDRMLVNPSGSFRNDKTNCTLLFSMLAAGTEFVIPTDGTSDITGAIKVSFMLDNDLLSGSVTFQNGELVSIYFDSLRIDGRNYPVPVTTLLIPGT